MENHDELVEIAAAEIAALVARLEDRGTCPQCLAILLFIAASECAAGTCEADTAPRAMLS